MLRNESKYLYEIVIESARSSRCLKPIVVSPGCDGRPVTPFTLSLAPSKIFLGICPKDGREKNKMARMKNPVLFFFKNLYDLIILVYKYATTKR